MESGDKSYTGPNQGDTPRGDAPPHATAGVPPHATAGVPPHATAGVPPHATAGAPRPGGPYPYGPPRPPYGPPPAPRGRSFGGCFVALILLILVGGGLFVMTAVMATAVGAGASSGGVFEKHVLYEEGAENKVAILSIDGVITEDPEGFVKKQIDRVMNDPAVKAVVLRVDSPGGTISGSDYYLHHLKKMKSQRDIPVVVSMGPIAASGGYYVSMCGDRIFAERTTFTGSIGVIIPLFNAADLLEKIGVEENSVVSRPLKDMGSFAKPMTPEEEAIWQALVDEAFALFKEVIREGRPQFDKNPEKLDEVATGQIYTAPQALDNGLIDEIGFIEDAVEWVIDDAGLDRETLSVVRYDREKSIADLLLGAQAEGRAFDPESLARLATPRGYYICPRGLPISSSR